MFALVHAHFQGPYSSTASEAQLPHPPLAVAKSGSVGGAR